MADIETRTIRQHGTPQNASRHPGLLAQAGTCIGILIDDCNMTSLVVLWYDQCYRGGQLCLAEILLAGSSPCKLQESGPGPRARCRSRSKRLNLFDITAERERSGGRCTRQSIALLCCSSIPCPRPSLGYIPSICLPRQHAYSVCHSPTFSFFSLAFPSTRCSGLDSVPVCGRARARACLLKVGGRDSMDRLFEEGAGTYLVTNKDATSLPRGRTTPA